LKCGHGDEGPRRSAQRMVSGEGMRVSALGPLRDG
jgi:hypothetical protein